MNDITLSTICGEPVASSPESVERWLKILREMADRCGAAAPEKE